MQTGASEVSNVRFVSPKHYAPAPLQSNCKEWDLRDPWERTKEPLVFSVQRAKPKRGTFTDHMKLRDQVPRRRGETHLPESKIGSVGGVVPGCRLLLFGWRAILWFPMSIRMGIGRGCRPDLRIQAFQLVAGAPADEADLRSQSVALNETGLMPNLRRSLCCAGRVAGLAAIHVLIPGIVPILEKLLCVSGLVAAFIRSPAPEQQATAEANQSLMEWKEFSLVQFLKEVLEQMYGPMMICRGIKECWSVYHAESYYLMECSVALMEVDRAYKHLAKKIARGQISGSSAIEKAWIQMHKKSAQRVAPLLRDLPEVPPLKALLDFLERNSIELGQSLDGCSFPVHCLSDGNGFSLIIKLAPATVIHNQATESDAHLTRGLIQNGRHSSMDSLFTERASSSDPLYQHRSISEISELPLEAELEMLMSEDDEIHEAPETAAGVAEVVLPLYGRQDHIVEEAPLTSLQKAELTLRGLKLFIAFLPFILLGVFLLLIAYSLDVRNQPSKSQEKVDSSALLSNERKKWGNKMRTAAFGRLLQGCRDGGAAFIKWGQWSSSREDLFPVEFCDVLSALHDRAPVHGMRQTRKEILRAFGRPIEEIFEAFEQVPLASGSVAQVHRALYNSNGRTIPVIVKVRHPNVGRQIRQDFQILKPLAGMASTVPSLKNLPLQESVAQFSNTMTAQTDFRVEAAHIRRFSQNFEAIKDAVVIPKIIDELVSESVLVETFEEGVSVSHFIKNPSPMNTKIVTLGVDAYLKMLLTDNFVHTDLHPGNIMVREVEQRNGEKTLQIVLLDFGLAEELRPQVRHHFISFLNLISKGDGVNAAKHLLQWSDDQQCPNAAAFIDDMQCLFTTDCNIHSEMGIDLDGVMKSVLRLARKHHVSIDSGYASLVIGVCIIVGFAHSLDPRVNLMDAATPVLLNYALTGRVVGRLYG